MYKKALDGKFNAMINLGDHKQALDIIDQIIRLEPGRLGA